MRFQHDVLQQVMLTRAFVQRDGVVTDHEKEILRSRTFKVTNTETGKIELTNILDYDGHIHKIPHDQNDLTLEDE